MAGSSACQVTIAHMPQYRGQTIAGVTKKLTRLEQGHKVPLSTAIDRDPQKCIIPTQLVGPEEFETISSDAGLIPTFPHLNL